MHLHSLLIQVCFANSGQARATKQQILNQFQVYLKTFLIVCTNPSRYIQNINQKRRQCQMCLINVKTNLNIVHSKHKTIFIYLHDHSAYILRCPVQGEITGASKR